MERARRRGHGVAHHGKSQAVAGHVLVRTHAALEYPLAVRGRDAGPIILDGKGQPLARAGARIHARAQPHAAAAPLAGIVEQVAEKLQ